MSLSPGCDRSACVRSRELDAVFGLSPDGLVLFDGEGRVRRVNAAFTRLTGLRAELVEGVEAVVFLYRLNSRCAASTTLTDLEALCIVPRDEDDGGQQGGQVVELLRPQRRTLRLGMYRDADERASQLLHLRDVTREAQIDQMKSEFLATAAHELRTPMASVYGFTELLMTRELPEARRRDMLERIYRQSGAMVAILNELLDLARIESGRGLDFEFGEQSLEDLVGEVLTDLKVPSGRSAVAWQPGPSAGLTVRADRLKLQQAVRNLLSNAYKYSPAGGPVEVELRMDTQRDGGPWACIAVRDHGLGLKPEERARVGERFYRVDKSGALPGTGLGVSIVRQITELHGGSLSIDSTPGQGSTFTLWIPAIAASSSAPEAQSGSSMASLPNC